MLKRAFNTIVVLSLMLAFASVGAVNAQVAPGYSQATVTFGDYTNWRPAPTTGTLTGIYRTAGNWVQTGTITCNACRMYFGGSVTINGAINAVGGVEANSSTNAQGPIGLPGINTGSGGSHGGAGGSASGGNSSPLYPYEFQPLAGTSGAVNSNLGGSGGGGLYIEAIGPIVLTNSAAINCDAPALTTINGGGGSGGGASLRTLRTLTINSGATISANGRAGGTAGGGGGIIDLQALGGLTNNGTLTVSGGAGGGGGAGSAGVILSNPYFIGPRLYY